MSGPHGVLDVALDSSRQPPAPLYIETTATLPAAPAVQIRQVVEREEIQSSSGLPGTG